MWLKPGEIEIQQFAKANCKRYKSDLKKEKNCALTKENKMS